MGLFRRKSEPVEAKRAQAESYENGESAAETQVDRMIAAQIPVFLSKLHDRNPPRWVTVRADRLESVTGMESPEYMADNSNHQVWSVDHFIAEFPFVTRFLNEARPDQSALFVDQSGAYTLD